MQLIAESSLTLHLLKLFFVVFFTLSIQNKCLRGKGIDGDRSMPVFWTGPPCMLWKNQNKKSFGVIDTIGITELKGNHYISNQSLLKCNHQQTYFAKFLSSNAAVNSACSLPVQNSSMDQEPNVCSSKPSLQLQPLVVFLLTLSNVHRNVHI